MGRIGQSKTKLLALLSCLTLAGCGSEGGQVIQKPDSTATVEVPPATVPAFSQDSAYVYIEKQLSFGPRIPNTGAHKNCADWLVKKFTELGCKTQVQEADVKGWDGTMFHIRNVIASYAPEKKTRILISSHWDSRPYADKDATHPKDPVPAANDGASGVAVCIELARILQNTPANVGVDFFLWDAEDYGNYEIEDSWCLGSQYWSKNKHDPAYSAKYGINLDMVGAKDAIFYFEGHTVRMAKSQADKVWGAAAKLGYSNYFQSMSEPFGVLDDHYWVMQNAGIPMVEVIDRKPSTGGFFPHWHTTTDDINAISKETLQAVGQTVAYVIYNEK